MPEDEVFSEIERMVGAFFQNWAPSLAAAISSEDKIRRLCSAGDYGSLFEQIMMHAEFGDFGDELRETIDDFIFMRSAPSDSAEALVTQPRWDEPILKLLKDFRECYCA